MADLDFDAFDVLTFDCYGTLIDWEAGLLGVLRPWADARGLAVSDEQLLTVYGTHEAEAETSHPGDRYPLILARSFRGLGAELGSMKVTEQVDALYTLGTNPVRYLVVPRFLACLVMVPLLTVYADIIGILGGFTTFSSFGNETMNLWRDGEGFLAFLNVAAQLLLGLGAVWLGRALGHKIWG